MREIVFLPNSVLRKKAQAVTLPLNAADEKICNEMIEYIKYSQNQDEKSEPKIRPGVGIAAPQLGYSKQIFYILDSNEKESFEELLINPSLVSHSVGTVAIKSGEGCLSVLELKHDGENTNIKGQRYDTSGYVRRYYKVIVKGYSYFQKKEITFSKSGYHAIVLQHELDHLNGKLFIDHLNRKDPWFKDENMKLI